MTIGQGAMKIGIVTLPALGGIATLHAELLVQIGAVTLGLAFGALWRTASLVDGKASRGDVWRDMLVSGMIGGANAALTLTLAEMLNLSALLAMGLAVIIGATGLRALPEIKAALYLWIRRALIGDHVALIQPKDEDMEEQTRQLDNQEKKP